MAEELFIPKLGQTVEEVTIINWLVKDGEHVDQGQEVLEVETDKAVFNIEAVESGYIHIGPYKPNDVVSVLTIVAIIGEKDTVFKTAEKAIEASQQTPTTTLPTEQNNISSGNIHSIVNTKRIFASPRARKLAQEMNIDLSTITPSGGSGSRIIEADVINFLSHEVKASPLAKRIAKNTGLDLHNIKGSGQKGEITKSDVEAVLKKKLPPLSTGFQLPSIKVSKREKIGSIRNIISQKMALSAQTTARVTLFMDADATALVAFREKLKAEKEVNWGFVPGYNELIAKLCAFALRRFPYMNARINEDTIEELADVNIGIAIDAERGLYVPVIKKIDEKGLQTISTEFRQRVDEVRNNKISPENLAGGTFTITNLGMYDVDSFTPIINFPEAAILGVGNIASKPIVLNEQVAIRKMMTLSLVFDHRLIDGAPAAQFLQYIKELLEHPSEILLTK